MTTNEDIEAAAKLFRRTSNQLTKDKYPSYWGGSFPGGTCGDVSLILDQTIARYDSQHHFAYERIR